MAQTYPDAKVDAIIKRQVAEFARVSREPLEAVRGWAISASRDLYRRLVSVGDLTGALRAVKQVAELAEDANKPGSRREEIDI